MENTGEPGRRAGVRGRGTGPGHEAGAQGRGTGPGHRAGARGRGRSAAAWLLPAFSLRLAISAPRASSSETMSGRE